MVAMAASAAASLARATPVCSGGISSKRVMQSLMALQAAKLFVAAEAGGLRGRGSAAPAAASRSRTGLVKEEECVVGPFCPLYSSRREVSTRGFVARGTSGVNNSDWSASAFNGVFSLNGDLGGETTDGAGKNKKSESKKVGRDPNLPKRPPSAYFIFMETFRKEFKEANPDVKGVTATAKAGGEKWISMSDEEKAPYFADAAARKSKYEQAMADYKSGKAVENGVQV